MRNGIWTAILAAITIAATINLAAQETSSAQTRTSSPNAISVTGCVQKADPSSASTTTGAESSAADTSPKFVLANVMRSGEPAGTSGAAGAARANSGPKYPLAGDASKLTPHVGHQVEITGSFESSSSAPGTSGAPRLKIDSLRMISEACPQ